MDRRMESPLIRWKRQAKEAAIAKEARERETRERSIAEPWADAWTRARKHAAVIKKLNARHALPRDLAETDRRVRRVARQALLERSRQAKRPWR